MKILVDQNISFRLLQRIQRSFPETEHVKTLSLTDVSDYQIYFFAREHGFAAVFTQDEDFYGLLLEHNPPPKIIWLRTGNCSTAFLAEVILRNSNLILAFLEDDAQDCLEVYG
ncbi:MAG: DUF5615 family PIN-like protein [Saprospiraceae bacterium]